MLRKQLKQEAKQLIASSKPSPLIVTLIFLAVSVFISLLSSSVVSTGFIPDSIVSDIQSSMQDIANNSDAKSYEELVKEIENDPAINASINKLTDGLMSFLSSPVAVLLYLALAFVSAMISVGYKLFALNTTNGTSAYSDLLGAFSFILRLIAYQIIAAVFIFLWSLLFIVPGIIASYRYRMGFYLLAEHPELSPYACIKESSRMMKGHKLELFVIDLSFIGWMLLVGLPGFLGYAAMVWFNPYYEITNALYFRYLYNLSHPFEYASPEVN